MAKTTVKILAELLEEVQTRLAALSERVERLETAAAAEPPDEQEAAEAPAAGELPPPVPDQPPISEEELLAVSAALAAYLGVRVRIKKIRLLGSQSWAQQGRVWIQASHNLHQ